MRRANAAGHDTGGTMESYYLISAFLCWFYLVGLLIKPPKA